MPNETIKHSMKYSDFSKKLFIDLDYTLGFYNSKTDEWLLYENAVHSLSELKKSFTLILATANTKAKVIKLFAAYPELESFFSEIYTCEDIAPHFMQISDHYQTWIANGKISVQAPFLTFVHQLWLEQPGLVLPKNHSCNIHPPLDYSEWEKQVYFPHVAPNKAVLCGESGILIDDEFGNPFPNPIYSKMIQEKRAFFAGTRGGITPDTGANWHEIKKSVLEAIS